MQLLTNRKDDFCYKAYPVSSPNKVYTVVSVFRPQFIFEGLDEQPVPWEEESCTANLCKKLGIRDSGGGEVFHAHQGPRHSYQSSRVTDHLILMLSSVTSSGKAIRHRRFRPKRATMYADVP